MDFDFLTLDSLLGVGVSLAGVLSLCGVRWLWRRALGYHLPLGDTARQLATLMETAQWKPTGACCLTAELAGGDSLTLIGPAYTSVCVEYQGRRLTTSMNRRELAHLRKPFDDAFRRVPDAVTQTITATLKQTAPGNRGPTPQE